MKKLLLLPLSLSLLLPSCASYRMEGKTNVPTLDGQQLYLKVPHQDAVIDLDSCEVIHGIFRMDGELDSVCMGYIYLGGESLMPIVVEKGNIKIAIENSHLEVSGTPLNDRLYNLIKKRKILEQRLDDAQHRQMQLILDGTSANIAEDMMKKESESLVSEMNQLITEFVTENFDNLLALQIFQAYCLTFPRPVINPTIQEIINKAPESFKQDAFVKEYLRLAREE